MNTTQKSGDFANTDEGKNDMSERKTGTMSEWFAVKPSREFFTMSCEKWLPAILGARVELTGGSRYVRGPHMITEARNMGWNDLADWIESQGYKDAE